MNEREHYEGRQTFLATLSNMFFYWVCFIFCCACWYGVYKALMALTGWDR